MHQAYRYSCSCTTRHQQFISSSLHSALKDVTAQVEDGTLDEGHLEDRHRHPPRESSLLLVEDERHQREVEIRWQKPATGHSLMSLNPKT